jgi:hypothetical protein
MKPIYLAFLPPTLFVILPYLSHDRPNWFLHPPPGLHLKTCTFDRRSEMSTFQHYKNLCFKTPENGNVHCLILVQCRELGNPFLCITENANVPYVLLHRMKDKALCANILGVKFLHVEKLNSAENWSQTIIIFTSSVLFKTL